MLTLEATYNALLQEHEDACTLDCGCVLSRPYPGQSEAVAITFCQFHNAVKIPKLWKVEWNCHGWEDAGWTEDDRPLRFTSKLKAEQAIREFIAETKAEFKNGQLAAPYHRRDYRAMRA